MDKFNIYDINISRNNNNNDKDKDKDINEKNDKHKDNDDSRHECQQVKDKDKMDKIYNKAAYHGIESITYISLLRCKDRQIRMKDRLMKSDLVGIQMDAIDGNILKNHINDYVVESDANRWLNAPQDKMNWNVIATLLSHLETIRIRFNDKNVNRIVIAEDDMTWNHIEYWKRPISHYIDDLPIGWKIIQLSSQGPLDEEMMKKNKEGILYVNWQVTLYGAFAYCINRQGYEDIMKKFWNSDKNKWQNLFEGKSKLAWRDPKLPDSVPPIIVADDIIYNTLMPNAYSSTIPFFEYEGIDSTIHPEHLARHNVHLQFIHNAYLNDEIIFYDKVTKYTPFLIVSCGRNNKEEIIPCLSSIISQRYPIDKFEIAYGDDNSDENIIDIIQSNFNMNQNNKIKLSIMTSLTRSYASGMRDMLIRKHFKNNDQVVILVDGDDKLADPHVLSYIDSLYRHKNIWVTYGGYTTSEILPKIRDWGDWKQEHKLVSPRKSKKW